MSVIPYPVDNHANSIRDEAEELLVSLSFNRIEKSPELLREMANQLLMHADNMERHTVPTRPFLYSVRVQE